MIKRRPHKPRLLLLRSTAIVCTILFIKACHHFYSDFQENTLSSNTIQCCGTNNSSCSEIIESIFPSAVRKRAPDGATFATTIVFIGDSQARHTYLRTAANIAQCLSPTDAWQQSASIAEVMHKNRFVFFYEAFSSETSRRGQRMLVRLIYWKELRLASLHATIMEVVNNITQAEEELRGAVWRDSRVFISIHIGTWDAARPDIYSDGHNFTYIDLMRPPPRLPVSNDPALQPLHVLTVEELMERFSEILLSKTEEPLRRAMAELAQLNMRRARVFRSAVSTLTMLPSEYVILFSYPVGFNCSSPARFSSKRVSRNDDPFKYLKSLERCRRLLLPAWAVVHNVVDIVVQSVMNSLRFSDVEPDTFFRVLDLDSFLVNEGKDTEIGGDNIKIDRRGVCYMPDGVHFDDSLDRCRVKIQNAWWNALPKGIQS